MASVSRVTSKSCLRSRLLLGVFSEALGTKALFELRFHFGKSLIRNADTGTPATRVGFRAAAKCGAAGFAGDLALTVRGVHLWNSLYHNFGRGRGSELPLSAPPGQERQPTTSKDFAKHPKRREAGWWFRDSLNLNHHPVCAVIGASQYFSGRNPPLLACC